MPKKKKKTAKKSLKKQTLKKTSAKRPRVKKTKKRAGGRRAGKKAPKKSVRKFPPASKLPGLGEEHIAMLATTIALAQGVDDPPGACITVDTSGRMSCRITRQSMCTGPNAKFYPHKACPAG